MLLAQPSLFASYQKNVKKAENKLHDWPEVYLKIDYSLLETEVVNYISIDSYDYTGVYAYVNPTAFQKLKKSEIGFKLAEAPGEVRYDLNMKTWAEIQNMDLDNGSWNFYPTYEAYESMMYNFAEEFSEISQLHNILTLPSARKLLFIQINVNPDVPKPKVMYTSTMHGDETAGFNLSLRLIHYLLSNYGEDEQITQFLDSTEIWICPNENPDGSYRHNNATLQGATRGNSNGIDLNRNYPNPVSDPYYDQQIETTAMINFFHSHNFVLSANMHGGIELVNYPFDSWTSNANKHADHNWWDDVMYDYVNTVRQHAPSNYMTGMGDGVTHGGDWYVIYGSRQDYLNYYAHCREFTLELSNQKLLNPIYLDSHWEWNYRSLINYLKEAHNGIRGTVKDFNTNQPVEAIISVLDHDQSNSEVFSSAQFGDFYRPIEEGIYTVVVSADNYDDVVIDNVHVTSGDYVDLEVFMGEVHSFELSLVASPPEGGNVSGEGVYDYSEMVNIEAVPADNYVFMYWKDLDTEDIVSHEPQYSFLMPEHDLSYTAYFGQNVMTLEGSVWEAESQASISLNIENVDEFVGFQLDVVIPEGFVLVENSIHLHPDRMVDHGVSYNVLNNNVLRIMSFSSNNTAYLGNEGEILSFDLITPSESGSYYMELENAILSNINSENVLSEANGAYIIVTMPDFLLTYEVVQGSGTLDARWNGVPVASGSMLGAEGIIAFKASPDPFYEIGFWKVNGELIEDYLLNQLEIDEFIEDTHVEIGFETQSFELSLQVQPENTGTVEGEGMFDYDATVEVHATPSEGYVFQKWINGQDELLSFDASYVFQMPAQNISLIAVFEEESTLTISDNIANNKVLKVFPNPSRNYINIEANEKMYKLEIVDFYGRIIWSESPFKKKHTINLEGIQSGNYFLRAAFRQSSKVTKFVIEK